MRRLTRPGARRALHATALSITLLGVLAFASSAFAARDWLNPKVVSNPANPVTDVDVAMDKAGNVLATWSETISGSNIIRASYRPAGGSFGAAKSLSAAGANAGESHPAFDAAGNAIVVWLRNGVVQFATRPAGASSNFSSAQDASNPAISSSVPEVDVADNGRAFIVFVAGGAAQLVVRHPDGQRDPTVPLSGTPVDVRHPVTGVQLAVNGKGDAVFTWDRVLGNYTVEASYRPAGATTTPSSAQQLSGAVNSFFPQPALDPQGRATIVWESCPAACSEILSSSRQAGAGQLFTSAEPIITGGNTFLPSVDSDSEGSALASWINDTGAGYRVQTSFRPVNSSFQSVINVGTAAGNTFGTATRFDPEDNAIVVFNRDVTGGTQVQASFRPRGGVFGGVDLVSATGVSNQFGREPKLDLDAQGNGVVAYFRFNGTRNVAEVAGYDAKGPALSVNVPATGTTGQGLGFSASPKDVWSAVTTRWDFGDGTGTVTGNSVGHAYTRAGTFTVRVTATDAVGNATSTTRTIQIANPPAPPPVVPPPGGGGSSGSGSGPTLIPSTLANDWLAFPQGFTKVKALSVSNLLPATTVRVTCKTKRKKQQKKGCPYKKRTVTSAVARTKLNLRKPFRKKKLPPGTKITVTIIVPGQIGKQFSRTTRKGDVPKRPSFKCIPPGGKPQRCV